MKKNLLAALMLLCAGSLFANDALLDHYRLYASLYKAPEVLWSDRGLEVENAASEEEPYGWTIQSYDETNAYLELNYETGDGGDRIFFALYKKQDQSYLIGVCRRIHDGISDRSVFAFYEKQGTHLKEVTAAVMPDFDSRHFFKPGFDLEKIRALETKIKKPVVDFYAEIPRFGTRTVIKLIFQNYSFLDNLLTPEEKELLRQTESAVILKEMAFQWNRKAGKFVKTK